jgi:ribosome biogenesis GTPase
MDVADIGWNDDVDDAFRPYAEAGLLPGRIARQSRDLSLVLTADGERDARVSGRFRRSALAGSAFPAVGDWAALRGAPDGQMVIDALLPRRTAFSRKSAGEAVEAQVVAANVDVVLLVSGLDGDFALRRIERYVTTAWSSGAQPVIVLNKADLATDLASATAATAAVAPGVPIVTTTAVDPCRLDSLMCYLLPGRTIALLGSSGVGKSTLINALLGEDRFDTSAVRSAHTGRGRHTTTARELVRLPGGALLIDTPGMRELGLWADREALDRTFDEIDHLAEGCRFPDCAHRGEPGCAVRAAVDTGELDAERLGSFLTLARELDSIEIRQDEKARRRHEKVVGREFAARRHEVTKNNPRYGRR